MTTRAPLQTLPVPGVFGRVSMDIVGPLNLSERGNKYILTCMDYLTRYPELISIPDNSSNSRQNVCDLSHRQTQNSQDVTNELGFPIHVQFIQICQILRIEKLSPLLPLSLQKELYPQKLKLSVEQAAESGLIARAHYTIGHPIRNFRDFPWNCIRAIYNDGWQDFSSAVIIVRNGIWYEFRKKNGRCNQHQI